MLRTALIALVLAIIVVMTLMSSMTQHASAQVVATPEASTAVSIIVIDRDGKLLPIEQFEARVDAGCLAAPGAPPAAHFITRSRGPAVALDLSEVVDPAPSGCGFGLAAPNTPGSAVLRIAPATFPALTAWTQRTGLTPVVLAGEPDPTPLATPIPTATPALTPDHPDAMRRFRVALAFGVPLALAAGVLAGSLVYRREQRRSATLDAAAFAAGAGVAIEDADVDDRLAQGHRGMVVAHPDRIPSDERPVDDPSAAAADPPADDEA